MSRTSRRSREHTLRRNEILDAALEEFAAKGFHSSSMTAIAKKADYSVGALYKYFPTKNDLYLNLFETRADEFLAEVRAKVAEVEAGESSTGALVEALLGYFDRNQKLFQLFLSATSGFQWNIRGRLGKVIYNRYREFVSFVAQLITEEVPSAGPKEPSAHELALALVGIINAFIAHWIEEGQDTSLLDLGEKMQSMRRRLLAAGRP